uniref:Uncharacterized protein n=1 Tax=Oryza brachyantha TaxID=4533 RepID=J3N4Q7_ORYBR
MNTNKFRHMYIIYSPIYGFRGGASHDCQSQMNPNDIFHWLHLSSGDSGDARPLFAFRSKTCSRRRMELRPACHAIHCFCQLVRAASS